MVERSLSIKIGLFVFALCLILGLAMNIRPVVMLKRAFISFIIFTIFEYLLISVIQKYLKTPKNLSPQGQERQEVK